MTESAAQDLIQNLYEGDTETPASTSDDYLARRALLNAFIVLFWEKEDFWRELFTDLASAADGTKTTTATTSAYSTPTNFKFPVGNLYVGTTVFPLISPEKLTTIDANNKDNFYYITGNKSSGYKVNIHPTPATTGETIRYEYYKSATQLTATSSVFEMTDPTAAIYYALHILFSQDGKKKESDNAFAIMSASLDKMKEINQNPGFFQSDRVEDSDFVRGVGGFGK